MVGLGAAAWFGVDVGLGVAEDVGTGVVVEVGLGVSVAVGRDVASSHPEQAKAAMANIADAIMVVIFFMVVNLSGSDWPDSP